MKRILIMLIACLTMIVVYGQTSGITLSYNKGKELKFFANDQLADAIEAAEVNDTIYLSTGEYSLDNLPKFGSFFPNARRLVKPLVFIGVGGHLTNFSDHQLYLDFDPSVDSYKRIINIEGIRVKGKVICTSETFELKFVNSYINSDFLEIINDGILHNLSIDRCVHVEEVYSSTQQKFVVKDKLQAIFSEKIGKAIINNSMLTNVSGKCGDGNSSLFFNHCYILKIDENFIGYVTNSIIHSLEATNNNTVIEDCLINNYGSYASAPGCTLKNTKRCTIDTYDINKGPSSFGNCGDDTPYGSYGGLTPLTLNSSYPTPDTSKSMIEYDDINKKLIITVKFPE